MTDIEAKFKALEDRVAELERKMEAPKAAAGNGAPIPAQKLKPWDSGEWYRLVSRYHQTRSKQDSLAIDRYMITHERPVS